MLVTLFSQSFYSCLEYLQAVEIFGFPFPSVIFEKLPVGVAPYQCLVCSLYFALLAAWGCCSVKGEVRRKNFIGSKFLSALN